jgi:pSer/pThr/pTyr-binding forkhead associated (FHA) protein
MTELWLKYKDENGSSKRVLVEGEKFTVGRTPDNDLSIPIPNLSRRHIQIERFADIFIVSDVGSSNGTTLNGEEVKDPIALKNGNKINLGGGVEIEIEMISDDPAADDSASSGGDSAKEDSENKSADSAQAASVSAAQNASAASGGSSIPFGLFIIAPLLGLFIIAIVGIVIFVSRKDGTIAGKKDGGFIYTSQKNDSNTEDPDFSDEKPDKKDKDEGDSTPTPAPTTATNAGSDLNGSTTTNSQPDQIEITSTPKAASDTDKIDRASIAFLRRIAANDPKAFLTGKQIAAVSSKVNQFKSSSALADNLKNAKRNSAQIEELARSKNLRPQFVATAALAQLGNKSGDVAKTAQGMLEVLSNLRASLGNELADDNLLIIAAYNQGAANQNLAMRDTVANLTNKFPNVSSRTVRTIWFLQENDKLSPEQYDFALKFLAIGIITQNPKDFNVQSEAVIFN